MSEILIIKNFGPIEEVRLDLRKFNVIIGQNATGKSTIAKVLAICRYFSYIIKTEFTLYDLAKEKNNGFSFLNGISAWGLKESIKGDSYIAYSNRHYSLTAKFRISDGGLKDIDGEVVKTDYADIDFEITPLSDDFRNIITELNKIKPKEIDLHWTAPTSFFQIDVARVMDNPFYLPTERGLQSLFSLGKSSISNMSDSLFNQLSKIDTIARVYRSDTNIEPLDISYRNDNGKAMVRKKIENEFYSLSSGASGYQSTIPIVLVIEFYNEVRKRNKTFIVEEPELNLFPTTQQKLIQYFADKIIDKGNSILLTTHSPYILTALNNLMYACQVGQKHKAEVDKIIPQKQWMNPDDVSCYLLENGTCENIITEDEEGGRLINAEKIDAVSTIINREFDKLIDIELGIADEKNQ